MKILLIGSGGREHAMAWKMAQNKSVERIYCAPGNGGTAKENKCENVNLEKTEELIEFASKNNIDLTVVGPEAPLVDGIVNEFKEKGLKIFGPGKVGAQLEGSKSFSKDFMKKYNVKTAEYAVFENSEESLEYLKKCTYPIVIKADGLAAGKGVVICEDYKLAEETIKAFMVKDVFKGSGKKVVIEEYLEGVEASILSITDGKAIIPFVSSKDHKQIFDGNKGPNTGGMGAISPNPYCTEEVLKSFEEEILKPTLIGIQEERMDFTGIIFFGLMITKKGVYLLEYNVRLGDPETQVVLYLMKSDFVDLINAAMDKKLSDFDIEWYDGNACCVVAASKGYPKNYSTGYEISGIDDAGDKVFCAGVKLENGVYKTSGGRVLCASARGITLDEAIKKAYTDIERIKFDGIYYRKDIGKSK
ncbi:phosphoribosylamine--glycine ligase [Clostridium acetobutylicum]|uniref:Phosphoribosylamine--glycine ligase n=1 Tax=Clostridium acetobutylicum (strain ATCC 824 / DSM 792 / JCM 1419 / IAM 19013 / LMG 5710 / NBRC 13948 / NRRL B-527 / VKM B-1787 / 2291 / W) TaxID=272562 RepID=PUR2_CLOAB|nr:MULTISPECIES: phosphoribosylamine--glycine ligase [Clostridium]Q97J90.1 RecName: Full=Phosphoribosylamine--glycine ligase; AltName: Full=GARS; AltName: Full=Glycinamide ribonucleotide synthetase; AltName: Full=Phosphoribosylglycinamide synthetase [Clostridium acetobutylicum ATCC 824]AAK79364.1 Phosphoribosylamine-glycine ligase [Clostridium acetobutylicum ATCC 824]ADZ20448.1 phosphoribosylamine--glycine ligase [Clostridium acetobutylicum EA 2018]AEI33501.1 phosphoribosylamine--glycine ligase